jgi:hypothetical protein
MMRRVAIAGVIIAGLLGPMAAAAPASAGASVGCNGNDCSALLSSLITLKGDVGGGSAQVPLDLAPPPCLWEPIGDATTGSQYIIQQFGTAGPGTPFGVYASVQQAQALLKNGGTPAGTWYQLPVNPAASAAGQAACLKLPLFYFAQPGQALPALPIPDVTLARYAYNHMTIPVPRLTINPAARGYVNLATYVWGAWPASPTTGRMDAYKIVAALGNQVVTVWAQPAGRNPFAVNASGPGTANSAGCGATGSHYPAGRPPPSAGAGTTPDCGVLWQAPTTTPGLTATVTWSVTWGNGDLNGPGPNALPPIVLTGPNPPLEFPVEEIQSINGPNG